MSNYDRFHDGRLPEYMEGGVRRWFEHAVLPGGFLRAVIEHDLFAAFEKADEDNREALQEWVRFFYNEAPAGSHGRGALKEWPKRLAELGVAVAG